MRYRAIIADDEPKIIQLIRQLGHWAELEIEIVDECRNGAEALTSILEHKPDFVLSDIKMPVYDGIELIRKVREEKLDPLFVLLSGYRHFEYARSAVQLNVMDYLLKPIDEEQLNDTLKKVCGRIDQKRAQIEENEALGKLREEQNQENLKKFWQCLIYENINVDRRNFASEQICNKIFHTEFSPGCYMALCVFTSLSAILDNHDTVSSSSVTVFIQQSFQQYARVYCHNTYMGYIIVLNFPEKYKSEIRRAISVLYYKIRDLREIYGEIRLNVGCSRVKEKISELPEAFQEAHSGEWGRLVLARNGILDYEQIASLPGFRREELITEEEAGRLQDCMKYLRGEELGDLFEQLYQRAGNLCNRNPGDMMMGFFYLQWKLLDCMNSGEKRKRMEEDSYYAYLNGKNFQKVIRNLYLVCQKYIEEEQERLREKLGKPIQLAVQFVRENYASQISLDDVAAAGNVSGSYLSKLFKSELGIGFHEFLTQVRLEESERLLSETNLSIREIAAQVGYLDEKYYSKLFKKTTGIKPTDYRRIYS